jgi:hypothetical protein
MLCEFGTYVMSEWKSPTAASAASKWLPSKLRSDSAVSCSLLLFCCGCCSREALVAGSQQRSAAKETEATAELDNRGLLQLQQQVMQQQDQELEQMEKTVISTKVGSCSSCNMSCNSL